MSLRSASELSSLSRNWNTVCKEEGITLGEMRGRTVQIIQKLEKEDQLRPGSVNVDLRNAKCKLEEIDDVIADAEKTPVQRAEERCELAEKELEKAQSEETLYRNEGKRHLFRGVGTFRAEKTERLAEKTKQAQEKVQQARQALRRELGSALDEAIENAKHEVSLANDALRFANDELKDATVEYDYQLHYNLACPFGSEQEKYLRGIRDQANADCFKAVDQLQAAKKKLERLMF